MLAEINTAGFKLSAHHLCLSFCHRLLGPDTPSAARFYRSNRQDTQTSHWSNSSSPETTMIVPALGDITNQLCCIQSSISSLSSKVYELSEDINKLADRVANIEEAAEQQSGKKRKVPVPPELSVSISLL